MYKYYLYTTRSRTSLPATEKRQSCIYRVGKRRLPDPSCKSSRPNKNSASPGPLSLSPLLRSPCPSGERASYDQQRRETKGRSQGKREASVLPYLGYPPLLFRSPSPEGPGAVHVSTFDRTKDYRPNSWTPWKASSSLENILLLATLLGELHSPSHSPVILPLLQRCPSSCLLHLLSRWTYVLTYVRRTYVRYRLPPRVYGIREWIDRGDHDLAASTNGYGYVRVRGSNAYKLLKIGPLFKLVSRFDTDRIPTSYRRLQDISPGRSFPTIPRLYRSLTGVHSFLLRLDYRSENATIFRQFALFLPLEDLCSRFLPFAESFRWSSANWNVEEYRLRWD